MALEQGCEVLISIDDDNYCRPESDFVGQHQVVGAQAADEQVLSSDHWFNLCSLLESDAGTEFFPRGFPYSARKTRRTVQFKPLQQSDPISPRPLDGRGDGGEGRSTPGSARQIPSTPSPPPEPETPKGNRTSDPRTQPREPPVVAVNAGLWLDDPDVDAVSRLSPGPRVQGFAGRSVVLGPDVWSPINTQNTALTRQAALTYYYVRMGYPLQGLTIDRYGDILSGYFTAKCVKHLGQAIRVGTPVADHRRTPHNLFKDLYHELAGMVLVEELLPWLIEERLEGSTYLEAYASLADHLAAAAPRFHGFIWDECGRDFLVETSRCMRTWLLAVRRWG